MPQVKVDLLAHVLDDADEGDGVAGLRVVLVAAQDEGGGHEHVQVEVVQLHAGLCRHLKQTEKIQGDQSGCFLGFVDIIHNKHFDLLNGTYTG